MREYRLFAGRTEEVISAVEGLPEFSSWIDSRDETVARYHRLGCGIQFVTFNSHGDYNRYTVAILFT